MRGKGWEGESLWVGSFSCDLEDKYQQIFFNKYWPKVHQFSKNGRFFLEQQYILTNHASCERGGLCILDIGNGGHPSTRSSRASNFSELKTFVDISTQLGRAEVDLWLLRIKCTNSKDGGWLVVDWWGDEIYKYTRVQCWDEIYKIYTSLPRASTCPHVSCWAFA